MLDRLAPTSPLARAGRVALLVLLGWFTTRHIADASYQGIYGPLNLALHEAGHLVFLWFGSAWLASLGGTLFHVLCVTAVGITFWRQRDPFAVGVATWWLGTVLVGAGVYAADARRQVLPLVTVGDGPVSHDWFMILEPLGLLEWDRWIGGLLRGGGLAMMIAAIAFGAWTVVARARPGR